MTLRLSIDDQPNKDKAPVHGPAEAEGRCAPPEGCCWDNAVVESFFSTLKHELNLDDDAEALFSTQQLQSRLAFWIDGYYNRERHHSTIGYISPIDYESSTSLPVNSPPIGPDHCPPNRGDPSLPPKGRKKSSNES